MKRLYATCIVGALVGCATGSRDTAMTQPREAANTPRETVVAEAESASEIVQVSAEAQDFTRTKSGLRYRILTEGNGRKPAKTDTVVCHYRGWLDNGKEFDSSYKRGTPATFPLNQVIPGWTEGLQHVSEGGKIELEIPSEIGYGNRGAPPDIPPNARLHFIVELIKVK